MRCCCTPKCITIKKFPILEVVTAVVGAMHFAGSLEDMVSQAASKDTFTESFSFKCCLTGISGLCIFAIAQLTRGTWLSQVLRQRVLNADVIFDNWRVDTLRSLTEVSVWMAVTWATLARTQNVASALFVGTFSGCMVVLVGEYSSSSLRTLEVHLRGSAGTEQVGMSREGGSFDSVGLGLFLPVSLLYVSYVFVFLHDHVEAIAPGFVICIFVGFLLQVLGMVLSMWRPTRWIGGVLEDRIMGTSENWRQRPNRSAIEAWSYVTMSLLTLKYFPALMALTMALLSGIALIFCNELLEHLGVFGGPTVTLEVKDKPPAASGGDTSRARSKEEATFTWAEVREHKSAGNAWIVVDGYVYDVAHWVPDHPGGSIILKFAGEDASDQVYAFHRPHITHTMRRFRIGKVAQGDGPAEPKPNVVTLEYRELRKRLWASGAFKPRLSYFVGKVAVCMGLLLGCLLLIAAKSTWQSPVVDFASRVLLPAVFLGTFFQQFGFLAHDAAHNGILPGRRGGGINWLSTLFGSVLFGVSSAKWSEEHSMHHAITMRPLEDPQFKYLPFFCVSLREVEKTKPDSLARFFVALQHITFLPVVMLIGRVNLHFLSWAFAITGTFAPGSSRLQRTASIIDLVGFVLHWLLWGSMLIFAKQYMQQQNHLLFFFLFTNWTVGVLHVQLLISHLATDTVPGRHRTGFSEKEEREMGFFAFQLYTTRNIDSTHWTHWFHGGLELQIEHHLFPMLPRHALSTAQAEVKAICERHKIPYRSVSFSSAVATCIWDLHGIATAEKFFE